MKKSGQWTVEGLFGGFPESYKLFKVVRQFIESLGSVKVEPAKTQVSFGTKTRFAWVWLPQLWLKKAPVNGIVLTIGLDRQV